MRISTQTREQTHFRAYNVRSRVQQPMFGERHSALRLHKASPQRRQSGAVAHDFGSLHRKIKMPRRYLRGNALWDRNQKTHQLLLLFPLSDKMY